MIFMWLGRIVASSIVWAAGPGDVAAKLDKWTPRFIPACQRVVTSKLGVERSARFCKCVAAKHKKFILDKIEAGESVDVDRHLVEVRRLYEPQARGGGVDAASDEPTVADLDVDISTECMPKK